MGLFSPFKFGLREYLGYNIMKFKDKIRFLEILVNRDSEMGGIIALFFDGATCTFKELPKADDKEALEKVYKYLDSIDQEKNGKSFFIRKKKVKRFINFKFKNRKNE